MIEFGGENRETRHSAPFLISSEEGEENTIRFIVALAEKGEKGADIDDMGIPGLAQLLIESVPLYPGSTEVYEIIFEQYLIHQTRNECLCCWDDYEVRHGNYFVIFEKSRLLDYLNIAIEPELAEAYWPNGWKHYGLYCQNHLIDIISPSAPLIRKISDWGNAVLN